MCEARSGATVPPLAVGYGNSWNSSAECSTVMRCPLCAPTATEQVTVFLWNQPFLIDKLLE